MTTGQSTQGSTHHDRAGQTDPHLNIPDRRKYGRRDAGRNRPYLIAFFTTGKIGGLSRIDKILI
jgi:hypothetical protein